MRRTRDEIHVFDDNKCDAVLGVAPCRQAPGPATPPHGPQPHLRGVATGELCDLRGCNLFHK